MCRYNGNPMLEELSTNLLLTIGPKWSLKIENIIGALGLDNRLWEQNV